MAAGRPREFDPDQALERALKVFWDKGYEGASLSDLTEAMGVNRPSLYAAFGNKEALFRQVVERYLAGPAAFHAEALALPTARAVAERLLRGTADLQTDPANPPGCLLVHGALSCGAESEPIRRELAARRAEGEARLRARFEQARADGDLPRDADPAALAGFVTAVLQGMAVQAAGGADRAALRRIAETALAAWPT